MRNGWVRAILVVNWFVCVSLTALGAITELRGDRMKDLPQAEVSVRRPVVEAPLLHSESESIYPTKNASQGL